MSPRDQLSRRIAPGIWEDVQGNPHWSIPELLQLFDLEDTPENRARVTDTIREVLLRKNPHATIVFRERPDS
jgi:hypothetical protein